MAKAVVPAHTKHRPDNEVLINYIKEGLSGKVGKDSADPYGQGRITVKTSATTSDSTSETTSESTSTSISQKDGQYTVVAGDSLWKIAQSKLDDGQRWKEIYEQNKDSVSNPSVILVGQELKLPAA